MNYWNGCCADCFWEYEEYERRYNAIFRWSLIENKTEKEAHTEALKEVPLWFVYDMIKRNEFNRAIEEGKTEEEATEKEKENQLTRKSKPWKLRKLWKRKQRKEILSSHSRRFRS
jgi:hypothetical protein